jgi:diguanylate cyclase (GGDEF)-like protein
VICRARIQALALALALMLGAASSGASERPTPSWAERVDALVQAGHDQPDTALARLQALQPASGGTLAEQRLLLLARGLVLAGSGRSTETWATASALRTLAGSAAAPHAALAQADALLVQAILADNQGQAQQAVDAAQGALDVYRASCPSTPDQPGLAAGSATPTCDHRSTWRALQLLARQGGSQGRASAAREHALAAVELARAAGDPERQSAALAVAADLSAQLGESDLARRQFGQAQRLARLHGSPRLRVRIRIHESRLYTHWGDSEGARRAADAGLQLARQHQLPRLEAILLANLSDNHVKAGRPRQALDAIERALPIVRRHGELRTERVLLANAGLARIGLGQLAQAREKLDELQAAFAAAGASADQATVLREFADALAGAGDLRGALDLYHRERKLAAELTAANRVAALAELRSRYDREAQQRRLDTLARDNKVIGTRLANRQALQQVWALGAVVLGLVFLLVALLYRRVREINRQLERSHAWLRVQSQRDPLTGLANRRCLHEHAVGGSAGAAAGSVQGALLLVDIDHFKRINDEHGHASGDTVLVEVARRLQQVVRGKDLVVRWGGEEFLIYAPGVDHADARALAQRVLQAVGAERIELAGHEGGLTVTASIGYGSFPLASGGPPQPLPLDRAINLVDMALYTAKNQGRNRAVGIASVSAEDGAAMRAVEADFDQAWREGRVALDRVPGPATAARPVDTVV